MFPLNYSDDLVIIQVECFRWWGYVGWLFTFTTGVVITKVNGILDPYLESGVPPPTFNVTWGMFNICAFFDYPPANMVLPVLFAFVCCIWMGYFVSLNWYIRAQWSAGVLSSNTMIYLTWSHRFEAATVIGMSLSWAVTPTDNLDDPYWKAIVVCHTAPYLLLQIGLLSLSISNFVLHHKCGFWERCFQSKTASRITYFHAAHLVLFACTIMITIPMSLYGIARAPWAPSFAFKVILQYAGATVFILGLAIPLMKDSLILYYWDKLGSSIHLRLDIKSIGGEDSNEADLEPNVIGSSGAAARIII